MAFEGSLGGFQLENHSTANDAALDEALDFFASDGGEDFFSVENASDVREINQLVSFEKFGAGGSHVVGVDVVKLVVRAKAETRSDGNQAFAPQRLDKCIIQASKITDEAETAGYFADRHRLG